MQTAANMLGHVRAYFSYPEVSVDLLSNKKKKGDLQLRGGGGESGGDLKEAHLSRDHAVHPGEKARKEQSQGVATVTHHSTVTRGLAAA